MPRGGGGADRQTVAIALPAALLLARILGLMEVCCCCSCGLSVCALQVFVGGKRVL